MSEDLVLTINMNEDPKKIEREANAKIAAIVSKVAVDGEEAKHIKAQMMKHLADELVDAFSQQKVQINTARRPMIVLDGVDSKPQMQTVRPKPARISDEVKVKVVEMKQAGHTDNEISAALGIKRGSINDAKKAGIIILERRRKEQELQEKESNVSLPKEDGLGYTPYQELCPSILDGPFRTEDCSLPESSMDKLRRY